MNSHDPVIRIIKVLSKKYPLPRTSLRHASPLEMLVSTILSAQCTDKRVNIVTSKIFRKYRTAKDYAEADLSKFEQEIRSTGFYRNKAKNIINAAKIIENKYYGRVPDTMNQLLELPGVARKTANVVLSNAFEKDEGIVVDTHVLRLSQRLGLTKNKTPKKYWKNFSHWLIFHGRETCNARKPDCPRCPFNVFCPSSTIRN